MSDQNKAAAGAAAPENGAKPAEQVQDQGTAKAPEATTSKPSGQSIAQVAGKEPDNTGKPAAPANNEQPEKKSNKLFEDMIEFKKENRELKRMIRDEVIPTIKALQANAGNNTVAKGKLDTLAEKWNLEPAFVKELHETIKSDLGSTDSETLEKVLADMQELKEQRGQDEHQVTAAQISIAIDQELDRVIADNPELGKIANKAAVKKFILADEGNLERKMEDILDELYGNAVQGKPSVDGYQGQGGQGGGQAQVNLDKPTDEDHLKIRKDPALFKQYQDKLIERLQNPSGRARNR